MFCANKKTKTKTTTTTYKTIHFTWSHNCTGKLLNISCYYSKYKVCNYFVGFPWPFSFHTKLIFVCSHEVGLECCWRADMSMATWNYWGQLHIWPCCLNEGRNLCHYSVVQKSRQRCLFAIMGRQIFMHISCFWFFQCKKYHLRSPNWIHFVHRP